MKHSKRTLALLWALLLFGFTVFNMTFWKRPMSAVYMLYQQNFRVTVELTINDSTA